MNISQEQFITILGEEESRFFEKESLNEDTQEDMIFTISRKTVEIETLIENAKNIDEIKAEIFLFIDEVYSENKFVYNMLYNKNTKS
jgi:hypothetical protein